ncbi:SDR family NAD(P)-dependent oxidoreductase [Sphingomonas sp.]|uniref:SDR family NAD(P)-dependent oxidoreductase n=1 Tax=Sphingomonas sp. TaxID=28214 RepID=UPI003B000705
MIHSEAPLFPNGAAVVIGGSGGIGREICLRLAQNGTDVALSYGANQAAAAEVVRAIEEAGRQATAQALRLEDADNVAAFLEAAGERFGRIHTIVCASGADISMVYVSQVDGAEWKRTIDRDLNGFFHVVQAGLPHLRRGGGSFVAMTSAAVARHAPKDILSIAPKAGIEALVRAVAREEGRFGIRANSIALGVIDTGLFHRLEARVDARFVEAMKRNAALQRFGSAREAADAAVFLASSAAGFITGTSLAVDGGFSI